MAKREEGQPEEVAVEGYKLLIGPFLKTLFPFDASSMDSFLSIDPMSGTVLVL